MKQPLQMLVIENYGSCNLRCAYCFPEHMWLRQGHHGAMPLATYQELVEKAFDSTTAEKIDVHFAGGEPLLAGRKWLEAAFQIGREIASLHSKQVTYSMQSNATTLTPELAQLLVENHVTVGVSIDGRSEINEVMRGSTEKTIRGYRSLTAAQGGRPPGMIVTVTSCNALAMHEVIDFLDTDLGAAHFRANQMGATASWNSHAAPKAEEWAAARCAIFTEISKRRGRIMEFNLAQGVRKFVDTLLGQFLAFEPSGSCCDMRCSAGRELLYFDQKGNAYPCPRANVTPNARIGHYADVDFHTRWTDTTYALDLAMTPPLTCRRCPAQIICDFGCHAFNEAQGNFFEVNCDATKEYFDFVCNHLDDLARIYIYIRWRDQLKERDDFPSLRGGIDAPYPMVHDLAEQLRQKLEIRNARPDLHPEILGQRYGWRDDLIPLKDVTRPRISDQSADQQFSKGGEAREIYS